jgi:signal transduction histidine kinase
MKRKLKIVLLLTTLLLTGIIILQGFWGFNAFKLNKEKFDADIDVVMQRALDSCKKDYFDSIRVVMVKRLSDTSIKVKFDTMPSADTAHLVMLVHIANKYTNFGNQPYNTTIPAYNFYRKRLNPKATIPEVLTEISFYQPSLMDKLMMLFGMEDTMGKFLDVIAYKKKHPAMSMDTLKKQLAIVRKLPDLGTYELPPNYHKADSIKLYKYFNRELAKTHPKASFFSLRFDEKPVPANDFDPHHVKDLNYSETESFNYPYHGFGLLQHNTSTNQLYVRAIFDRAQVGVLKEMILPLLLSGLLIMFTIFCFYYIVRTINQQRKLTELKDDFINNMTHELKTPIATITVAIEGLQKYNALNDPEKTQRYLQTSRNELNRLNDLVTKVLNMASFDSKTVSLTKETIPVDEMVNDLIVSEKAKTEKKISISYQNAQHIEAIEADKTHFRNVLANIIDNAVKYSEEPVDIKITLTKSGGNALFSIKDNGIGIPAAHLNHVFDKFHRVPAGNVHNVKGTGLGLNYVKYIVEAHGGTVAVISQVGAGSEFIVAMPLKHG